MLGIVIYFNRCGVILRCLSQSKCFINILLSAIDCGKIGLLAAPLISLNQIHQRSGDRARPTNERASLTPVAALIHLRGAGGANNC